MTARRAKKLLRTAEKRKWKENLAFCKRQLQKAVNSGEADCYCDALAKNADRVQRRILGNTRDEKTCFLVYLRTKEFGKIKK